jgi:hypothetical protein
VESRIDRLEEAGAPCGSCDRATSVDHLFAVGSDGRIYEKTWSQATGWSIWNRVGDGVVTSAPAAAMSRNGERTDLFARGTDNATWHNTRHPGTGGAWAGWYQVPGSVGTTSAPAVVASPSGELDLFIRGSDGQIYHKYGTDAAGWSQWNLIGPGVVKSAPTAIRRASGVIEVYVRGSDDRVYQKTKVPGGGWSIWNAIGANGLITAGPWAYVDQSGPDVVEVLARGNDNLMYRFMSGAWHGVGAPAPGAAPDPTAYGLLAPAQFPNDTLLRDESTGRVYLYAAGAVAWVTNATVAARLEYDLATATNVQSSVIGSFRRANDITEHALASPDEPSSGTGGTLSEAGHPKPDDGYFWEAPDPAGDQNRFVFSSMNSKAEFRGTLHWYRSSWNLWKRYVQWQAGSRSQAMTAGVCQTSAFGAKWGGASISWSWPPGVTFGGSANSEGYTRCPPDAYTNAANTNWGGHRPKSSEGKTKGNIKYVVVTICYRNSANSPTLGCRSKKGNRRGYLEDW